MTSDSQQPKEQPKTTLDATPSPPGLWTVPNQLTIARLVLSIVVFVFIAVGWYLPALAAFVVAVSTDWLDGYIARKYNLITKFGRVIDPFADKIIICGTFIFLAAEPGMRDAWYGLHAWMVVVVVGRELLVTMLRSHIEGAGGDFSAKMSGKLKMVAQCAVAPAALLVLSYEDPTLAPSWVVWLLVISIWATLVSTVYSGILYVIRAIAIGRSG